MPLESTAALGPKDRVRLFAVDLNTVPMNAELALARNEVCSDCPVDIVLVPVFVPVDAT